MVESLLTIDHVLTFTIAACQCTSIYRYELSNEHCTEYMYLLYHWIVQIENSQEPLIELKE